MSDGQTERREDERRVRDRRSQTLRYELGAHLYAIRVYSGRSDRGYIGSAVIEAYGDRAWLWQIEAPVVMECMLQNFDEICDKLGVQGFEGYMNPSVERALRMMLHGRADLSIESHGKMAGREMNWVVARRVAK